MNVGIGYDIHPLVRGRRFVLGGEEIPFDKGLAGHSDADALCHAVADALLGACALGDIGQHFPDADPAYKDASSIVLLGRVSDMVKRAGYRIVHVDATVIAEKPKLQPYRARMAERLAAVLGLGEGGVSVKAKTNEGFDAVGRGEAVAVHAVASVERTA